MTDLKDKEHLLGGSIIGKSIVEELAAQGCAVVFTYQSSDEAAEKLKKNKLRLAKVNRI